VYTVWTAAGRGASCHVNDGHGAGRRWIAAREACLMFHVVDVPGIGVSVCIAIGVAFGAGTALTALQCAFDLFVPPLTVTPK
jgi:hypothetical protein